MNSDNMLSSDQIIKEKHEFVKFSCIYFLIKNDNIVYVGQSNNGISRIYQHTLDKQFDSFSYIICDTKDLNNTEAKYIAKFSPVLNCSMPQNDYLKSIKQLKNMFNKGTLEIKKLIRKNNVVSYFHGEYYDINDIKQYL